MEKCLKTRSGLLVDYRLLLYRFWFGNTIGIAQTIGTAITQPVATAITW